MKKEIKEQLMILVSHPYKIEGVLLNILDITNQNKLTILDVFSSKLLEYQKHNIININCVDILADTLIGSGEFYCEACLGGASELYNINELNICDKCYEKTKKKSI